MWGRGAQGSNRLGREGVTGVDRHSNLGAVQGDGGRARNLGTLYLVPESESVYMGRSGGGGKRRTKKARKKERKDREGRKVG